jgi:hypothetical protein
MSDNKWDGSDRRQPTPPPNKHDPIELAHVYYRIEKLEEAVAKLTPKIDDLVFILERYRGAMWVLTKVAAVGAGLWAFVQWSKDHIKF